MIGVGSMGGSMSLLFAEHGVKVNFYDPSEDNVKALLNQAKEAKREDKVIHQKDYKSLREALSNPQVFVFSIPHGNVGDKTVEGLEPYMEKGDIIMDASNEYWLNTERRQKKLRDTGIHYIGMGVSGGYQSARNGPSISPGGHKEALDNVMPFLRKVAAKDKKGRPCTTEVGPQSDGIADLLENAYRDDSHSKTDLLEHSSITKELVDSYSAIKNVVLKCTEADCYALNQCFLRVFQVQFEYGFAKSVHGS
jgi:6-phosphogluconate dehydrogenase